MTINTALFAFPVNLIIGLSMVLAAWKFKCLSSDRHMTIALLLMIAAALVQGFMPAQASFTRSWPFVIVLTWFLTVLASRLFRKFSWAGLGLWIALWSGMLGSADATVTRVVVPRQEFTQTLLPFGMRMDEFQVDRYQTGEPMEYRAQIILRDANREQSKTLRVNHPVHFRGHQLYLMDYDTSKGSESDYCIVMVTRQPWRWLVLAGILIMLGGAFKTFIL